MGKIRPYAYAVDKLLNRALYRNWGLQGKTYIYEEMDKKDPWCLYLRQNCESIKYPSVTITSNLRRKQHIDNSSTRQKGRLGS